MSFDTIFATEGVAIVTVGLLVTTLAAILHDRNPTAAGLWSVSVVLLIFAGQFGLDQGWFWVGMILTTITIAAGMLMGAMQR